MFEKLNWQFSTSDRGTYAGNYFDKLTQLVNGYNTVIDGVNAQLIAGEDAASQLQLVTEQATLAEQHKTAAAQSAAQANDTVAGTHTHTAEQIGAVKSKKALVSSTDYIRSIVLLHKYNLEPSNGDEHYFKGVISAARINAINAFPTITVDSTNRYSTGQPRTFMSKMGEDTYACRLVKVTHQGDMWIAFAWYGAAQIKWMTLAGNWLDSDTGKVVAYYNEQTSEVLDAEIQNSIETYYDGEGELSLNNNSKVYHQGFKPNASDVGTYDKAHIDKIKIFALAAGMVM